MEDDSGERSIHQQTIEHAECMSFLSAYEEQRKDGRDVRLTFKDLEFTGWVLDAFCVGTDGTVVGVDGVVDLPGR